LPELDNLIPVLWLVFSNVHFPVNPPVSLPSKARVACVLDANL